MLSKSAAVPQSSLFSLIIFTRDRNNIMNVNDEWEEQVAIVFLVGWKKVGQSGKIRITIIFSLLIASKVINAQNMNACAVRAYMHRVQMHRIVANTETQNNNNNNN